MTILLILSIFFSYEAYAEKNNSKNHHDEKKSTHFSGEYFTLGLSINNLDFIHGGYQKRISEKNFWEVDGGLSLDIVHGEFNFNHIFATEKEGHFYVNGNGGLAFYHSERRNHSYSTDLFPTLGAGVGFEWPYENTRQAVELKGGYPYLSLGYVIGFH